ncbi:MAG: GTPase Era [Deltaproteobacteria bacterium]|uniref:GTPase Era n=1 Tax=Candidatus Zymogenus saltonus TaxID=2844893 RepID=A0A9D8PP02_9DELT|nr:GTPase Era [Candidatus Zymogenus saltonus]
MAYRCGFIVLMGRTNVGKSTLMNRLLSEKVSIISPKPQTTRNRIMGILTEGKNQMIFVDTPGIHKGEKSLNKFMNRTAREAAVDSDILVLMIDVSRELERKLEHDEDISEDKLLHPIDVEMIKGLSGQGPPRILLINKIDTISKSAVLPIMEWVDTLSIFDVIVPISALSGDGIVEFKSEILRLLPESPHLFPDDDLTDQSERFIAEEIIREKVFQLTKQEIPYSTAVVVEQFSEDIEREDGGLLSISALIYVEKESQKGIVIGKGGAMIKKIGTKAREDLELFFETKVFLDVRVKVLKDWSKREDGIKKMGYR